MKREWQRDATGANAARRNEVIALAAAAGWLLIVAAVVALSAGRAAPMAVTLAVPVSIVAMMSPPGRAVPVALLAAAVASSPLVTHPTAGAVAVLLLSAATYTGMVLLVRLGFAHRKLSHEAEQRMRGLETLQRVSAIVAGHLSLDGALSAIVGELKRSFGYELVSTYLLDGDDLVLQAQAGYDVPYERIPLGTGVCGQCAQTATTIFLRDVSQDVHYRPAVDGVVSEICAPLIDGGVIGILNIESRRPLRDLDRDLLELFAAQAAVVVRNARQAGKLRVQAQLDPLTGLLNHGALMERIDGLLKVPEPRFAVLMLDLDRFKQINDRHGHLVGDDVLRRVAAAVRSCCRQGDDAGRYGGDEFMLVLPGADAAAAEQVGRRILTELPAALGEYNGVLALPSLGWAVAPGDGIDRNSLIARADATMYAAKRESTQRAG